MEHNERLQAIEKITSKILKEHKEHILFGGICGSTARNEDHDFSDIELLFIIRNNSKLSGKDFLFGDIQIAIAFTRLKDAEKILKNVDLYWPLKTARFFSIKKICGDEKILQKFHKTINSIPQERFFSEIRDSMPHITDLLNKIRNARIESSLPDAIEYVRELLYGINLSLGLLNRRYFTRNYYKNFLEAFKFKKLPEKYEELVKKLWISKDLDEIASLSEELAINYFELLENNGIKMAKFSSIDDVSF